jgi:tetratricopeptide (TPR) repeat protein
LWPGQAAIHFNLGLISGGEGKWAEAEREFETALRIEPGFSQALEALTEMLVARNEAPRAVRRVQQQLATDPKDAGAHLLLARLHMNGQRYEAAKIELLQAAELKPGSLDVLVRLGEVYQNLGQADQAIASYEAALSLQPKSAMLHTVLGNLQSERNRVEAARKHYEAAILIDTRFAPAVNNLAWLHLRSQGNVDVALGLAQKAKELQPGSTSATDTLAWAQYKKGLYAAALPLLQDCVKASPASPMYHYHLGMVLVASGATQQARTQLQTALRLKLGGEDAQQARQTLAGLD